MLIYDFNLLVSHEWRDWYVARDEILRLLSEFGDPNPVVRRTLAKGLTGVRTTLDNRTVIRSVREKFSRDPLSIQFTLKWRPVDRWCEATIESMKDTLSSLKDRIKPGERWMMHVEKRRYDAYHKAEIINKLAELIQEKVDFRTPDKIVWIEIIGKQAGISVVTPDDVFSLFRMRKG